MRVFVSCYFYYFIVLNPSVPVSNGWWAHTLFRLCFILHLHFYHHHHLHHHHHHHHHLHLHHHHHLYHHNIAFANSFTPWASPPPPSHCMVPSGRCHVDSIHLRIIHQLWRVRRPPKEGRVGGGRWQSQMYDFGSRRMGMEGGRRGWGWGWGWGLHMWEFLARKRTNHRKGVSFTPKSKKIGLRFITQPHDNSRLYFRFTSTACSIPESENKTDFSFRTQPDLGTRCLRA